METLYRKVAVSERLPKEEGEYIVKIKNFGLIERCEFFDLEDFHNDWKNDVEYWLEEIPNNSHQIEKLEADKAELLEALETANLQIKYLHEKFKETGSGNTIVSKNKSLIQKMKQ